MRTTKIPYPAEVSLAGAGFVYILSEYDLGDRVRDAKPRHSQYQVGHYIKIGRSHSIEGVIERIKTHQTGNPREVVIEALLPTDDVGFLEAWLHGELAEYRVHGREWFALPQHWVLALEIGTLKVPPPSKAGHRWRKVDIQFYDFDTGGALVGRNAL